jgi:hypothetical protein
VVEDTAEAIEITAGIERGCPGDLLRSHVQRTAQGAAGHGQQGAIGPVRTGEAEIREFRPAIGGKEDVRRFEVAVDQLGRAGDDQGGGDLPGETEDQRLGQRAVEVEEILQIAASHVFEHQELPAVRRHPRGQAADDVRVVEAAGDPGFTCQALLRVTGGVVGGGFVGYLPQPDLVSGRRW